MRRASSWLLAFSCLCTGEAYLGAQEVPAVHRVIQEPCEQPQRIIVKLPPPKVEVRDKTCNQDSDTDSTRRCCLLGHCRKPGGLGGHAPLGQILYAPAS